MLKRWWARIWAAGDGEEIHAEIAAEREFHLEMATQELVRRGMSKAEAQETTRRKFGPALRIQEEGFDVRGGVLTDIAQDFRIALRLLLKSPAKTLTLVATVALGIGINTAVFSVMKAVVLDPLPFPQSENLVAIHQVSKGISGGVSYPNFEDWRRSSKSFEGMAVYAPTSATLTTRDRAQRIFGATVSSNLLALLGVTPLRGRLFVPTEDLRGSGRPVVISDNLWHSLFQASEQAIGQPLTLDGVQFRVIGVIPAALAFPIESDALNYWTTVSVDAEPSAWGGTILTSRGYPRYEAALARLKPGVTAAQAQAEMSAIAAIVAQQHPDMNLKEGVRVGTAVEDVVGKVRPLLWILYAAVFCVLAAGCANTATLLLVGAIARRREFALRAALGARPSRLVRQLMVESLAVAVAGGACGAMLAWVLTGVFVKIAPPETPRLNAVHGDGAMLLYVLGLSLLTGLVFGVAPALASLRHDLVGTLKDGAVSPGAGPQAGRLRPGTLLIAVQIALSMMLVCSAAVLTGSFWHILHVPRGFDSHNVLTATISLPTASYPQGSEKVVRFYADLIAEMQRVPGVVAASAGQSLPLSGQNNSTSVQVAGASDAGRQAADLRFVDPAYFSTLRIPLLSGRFLEAADGRGQPEVVVVNRTFAERFLWARNPVGARLRLGWGGDGAKVVAGVVGDIRHNALGSAAGPEVYVPLAQFPLNDLALILRTEGNASAVAQVLRERVGRIDASLPVEDVRTLDKYLQLSAAPQRFLMWVLVAFAASTLLLAAIGLYGALSYSTACRRHEFGVRMALGSDASGLMRLVLGEGLKIVLCGMMLGLALTAAASRFLAAWLYETSPLELRSLACAGATLMIVAVAACWLPARRAARVSPAISLRGD